LRDIERRLLLEARRLLLLLLLLWEARLLRRERVLHSARHSLKRLAGRIRERRASLCSIDHPLLVTRLLEASGLRLLEATRHSILLTSLLLSKLTLRRKSQAGGLRLQSRKVLLHSLYSLRLLWISSRLLLLKATGLLLLEPTGHLLLLRLKPSGLWKHSRW